MALENLDFKRPNWSHLGRTGWGEERRREEEEEEEKKRRTGDQAKQAKGMDACLWYGTCDFYMELYGLYGILV